MNVVERAKESLYLKQKNIARILLPGELKNIVDADFRKRSKRLSPSFILFDRVDKSWRCTLCDSGRMTGQCVVDVHLVGTNHTFNYDTYSRCYESYLVLLAFTKYSLCSRYGSLQAGRDSCSIAASSLLETQDHFMLGPQPKALWLVLWYNCLRFASAKGTILVELVFPYLDTRNSWISPYICLYMTRALRR